MRLDTALLSSARSPAIRAWRAVGVAIVAAVCLLATVEAADLHPAAHLPAGWEMRVRQAIAQVEAASSLAEITTARQRLDRLEERQQQAATAWLLKADARGFPPGPTADQAAARRPLDWLITQLRWRLAAAFSRQLREAPSPAVAAAAASRDLRQLHDLARTTLSGVTACRALLAAGDVAAEQGWPTAAREAWQQAAAISEWIDSPPLCEEAAARQAFPLEAQSPGWTDCGSHRAPGLPAIGGERLWQQALPAGARPIALRLTAAADGGPQLVCWHSPGGIHARQLADGRVPWSLDAAGPSSDRLFPPAGDRIVGPTWAPGVQNGRLISLAAMPSTTLLLCLDITESAEGRLQWTTPLAEDATRAIGEPVCELDGQGVPIAYACVQGAVQELIAIRLTDGHLLWRRPLGLVPSQVGSETLPLPAIAEDLVIVPAADGSVWAVERDGRLVWARDAETSSTTELPMGPLQAVVVACDTAVVCSPDGLRLSGLDLRSGTRRWQFAAPSAVSIVGAAGDLLVAFHEDRLVSLAGADGRVVASRSTAGSPIAGVPLLASGRLYWPELAAADGRPRPQSTAPGRQVRVLAPATLKDEAPPLALNRAATGSLRLAGDDRHLVVCDGATITVFGTTAAD